MTMPAPMPVYNQHTGQWELPAYQGAPAPGYSPPGPPPQRSRIDELRAQMLAAQVTGRGSYFPPNGKFRVQSKMVKYQRSPQQGVVKESIVAEFTVLTSNLAEVQVGGTKSNVFSFKHQGWLERFKALALALGGFDPDGLITPEVNARVADIYVWLMDDQERVRAGAPADFLQGRVIDLETFPGTSRNNISIVHHKWSPVQVRP